MFVALNELSLKSRAWAYPINRLLTEEEVTIANIAIESFVTQWTSHSRDLKAHGAVYFDAFVVLMVDEKLADASGCSIDKSVRFLEDLERRLNISVFDRQVATYMSSDGVKMLKINTLSQAMADGLITDQTPFFDPLISTKDDFENHFLKRLSDSWLMRFA
jgi:hypothetical protein